MDSNVLIHCGEHSGFTKLFEVHTKQIDNLFVKIDRLQFTAFGLLIAVIADILTRVYLQHFASKGV